MDGTNPALEDLLAHTRWVEDLARRLVRDPAAAHDLAQSAWAIALRDPMRPRDGVRGWLGAVVRNLAREGHRREAQRRGVEQRGARAEGLPSAHDLVARAEAERDLVRCVTELDEPHRTLLLLHYFEALSTAEIARREGVTTAAIAHRLTRAHARLRERLEPRGGGTGWLAALAPILRPDPNPSSSVGAGSTAPLTPNILMATSAKIVVPALLVAGLCTFLFLNASDAEEPVGARVEVATTTSPTDPVATTEPPVATDRRIPAESPQESRTPEVARVDPATSTTTSATPAGGRIHGLVLRPDTSPAAGRRVRLLDMKPKDGRGFVELYTECDANGRFEKADLAAGTWSVSTWPNEAELKQIGIPYEGSLGGMAFLIERTVDVHDGGSVELALGVPPKDPIHVRGRILRGDEAVKAVAVQWLPAGEGLYDLKQTARVLEDGGYDVTLEHPGTYYVTAIVGDARPDWTVEIVPGREQTLDFALETNVVEGQVVDENGQGVAKATVELSVRGGRRAPFLITFMALSTATNADGRFRFTCLPDARYAVHAFGGALGPAKSPGAAVASSVVRATKPGEGPALVLTLAPGVSVPMRVVDAAGKSRSASVFVFDADGEALNPASGHSYVKDGARSSIPLAPGRYSAVAASGFEWSAPVEFEIVAGEVPSEVVLRLETAAQVEVDARAFPGSLVEARDDAGRRFGSLIDRARTNRAVERAWNSDVPTLRLPVGNYTIEARGIDGVPTSARVGLAAGENPRVVLER